MDNVKLWCTMHEMETERLNPLLTDELIEVVRKNADALGDRDLLYALQG